MPSSRRFRLSALLAGIAVVFASVLPAFPAAAEEPPAPDPVVTSEPTSDPTPDATPTAEPTPTSDPTSEPTPDATPTADPTPADAVQYTGTLTSIADEAGDGAPSFPLLSVDGLGFLRVDTTGLSASANLSGSIELTLAVPAGLTLSDNPATRFGQLAAAAAAHPLVAVDYTRLKQRQTANAINQTPSTAATHEVFAVLVSPNNLAKVSNQTAAEAASLVSYANGYWSRQSAGGQVINFHLAGTTTWYKSANSCKTDAGNTALWNQAAGIAKTQLGYVPGKNVHLMLIFPKTANCGGAIGLGTIGGSVNSGGLTWVLGGLSSAIRQATAAHELGHNLSMGHADWLECNSAGAPVGATHVVAETATALSKITGCEINYYGDMSDVMGFGLDDVNFPFDGGSLSSPSAIRAGVWPSSAWVNAGNGVTTQVINSVSSNTGVRSVVVQDSDGTNYFVELRNFVGDDSEANDSFYDCFPAPGTTGGGACFGETAQQIGVRILRIEPSGYQGLPGYDSFLIGHKTGHPSTPNGVKYLQGETYTTEGGTTILVQTLTSTTATIKVTRGALTAQAGTVDIDTTIANHGGIGATGDTLTAFMGETWVSDAFTFQWKNNGSNIGGATNRSYVLTPSDFGDLITVAVTGAISASTATVTSAAYGPIVAGALHSTGGTVGITGTLKIGATLTASSSYTVADINAAVAGTTTYQWYRNNVAIPSQTAATYMLQSADYLQSITVKAHVDSLGYTTFVSPASAIVKPNITGTIQGSLAIPTMVKTLTLPTFKLTATLPGGSVTEPGVTYAYQWYRVNRVTSALTAIVGGTHVDYTPVAGDYPYKLKVRVIVSKSNYDSAILFAVAKDYSLRSTPLKVSAAPAVASTAYPFSTETAGYPDYFAENDTTGVVETVNLSVNIGLTPWYRNGVAITGATIENYVVQPLDLGKMLTYRMNATLDGYLPIVNALSAASAKVIAATFVNGASAPTITGPDPTMKLTLTALLGDASPAATSFSIQWYRAGVVVAGKTTPTYTLTSADFDKVISVQVTYKRSGYANKVRTAVYAPGTANFSVGTVTPSTMTGNPVQGAVLHANIGTYEDRIDLSSLATDPGMTPANPSITWLRNGVPIAGQNSVDYTLVAADLGKTVSVRFTMTGAGAAHNLLQNVQTTPATQPIGNTLLDNQNSALSVTVEPGATATKTVLRVVDATPAGPAPVTNTYQWYRDSTAITGATKVTYQLVTADAGHLISARVITKKAAIPSHTYTTVVKTSPKLNWTIQEDLVGVNNQPRLSGSGWKVGESIGLYDYDMFLTKDGALVSPPAAIQWLRNGVPIAGAPATDNYFLVAADLGKHITARLTITTAGYLPLVLIVGEGPLIDPGFTDTLPTVTVVPGGTGILAVDLSGLSPSAPAPVYAYKWYRASTATPTVVTQIATTPTYKLVAADLGKLISVQVTMTRASFTVPVTAFPRTTGVDYSILGSGAAGLTGTPTVGQTLTATAPTFLEADGVTTLVDPPTLTYTWYRTGVVIPSQTADTYTLAAADLTKVITVKATASLPGRLARTSAASPGTTAVVAGVIDAGTYAPTTSVNLTTRKATVAFSGIPVTPAPFTASYKWYRNGALIAGATASTYVLLTTDTNKSISVLVTIAKAGYASKVYGAAPGQLVNGFTQSEPAVVVGTASAGQTLSCVAPLYYRADGSETVLAPNVNPNATQSIQWTFDGAPIVGETGYNYLTVAGDVGHSIGCDVTMAATLHKTQLEHGVPLAIS